MGILLPCCEKESKDVPVFSPTINPHRRIRKSSTPVQIPSEVSRSNTILLIQN